MTQAQQWTILDNYLPQESPTYEYSYAVHHSFGRGSFRAEAEKVVVPKIVLDQIIGKKCWTERPRGRGSIPAMVGGAGPAKIKTMGGVNVPLKPKSSGRARALHMRVQKRTLSHRKPGHQGLPLANGTPGGVHPSSSSSSCSGNRSCSSGGGCGTHSLSEMDNSPSPFSLPVKRGRSTSPYLPSSQDLLEDFSSLTLAGPTSLPTSNSTPLVQGSTPPSLPRLQATGTTCRLDFTGSSESTPTRSQAAVIPEMLTWQNLSPSAPAIRQRGEVELDWSLDCNTLYFSNIPNATTSQELVQCVEKFGFVTNVKTITKESPTEEGDDHNTVAYVRMEQKSACDRVISCFHGNPFENSDVPVLCRYALDC